MRDEADNDLAIKDDLAGLSGNRCSHSIADRLANEEIEKDRLGRKMAIVFATVMGVLCIVCIGFALWTGYRFLSTFDDALHQETVSRHARTLIDAPGLVQADPNKNVREALSSAASIDMLASGRNEAPLSSITLLSPLIPATFSSALGLLILVTLARFTSNFVLSDKHNPPKDQEYGALAVLIKEIGAVVHTLRGKDK